MKGWIKVGGAILGGVAAAAVVAARVGAARWDRETARAVGRLTVRSALSPPGPDGDIEHGALEVLDPARLTGLPEPVRRYFAFALTPGQRLVRRARIEHEGGFAEQPGKWRSFTSVQHFAVEPPGFVWNSTIQMMPLAPVWVRDGYVDGEGAMHAALRGLITVADQRGTPEIAASALWRYLAEAVWLPTALLPSPHLTWTAIDDSSARATLTDGPTVVMADFHFGPDGEIVRVTGDRYRAVGGSQQLTPTEGRHSVYARVGGMMIPTQGEVAWLLPDGAHAYWRARVVRATYEYDAEVGLRGAPGAEVARGTAAHGAFVRIAPR